MFVVRIEPGVGFGFASHGLASTRSSALRAIAGDVGQMVPLLKLLALYETGGMKQEAPNAILRIWPVPLEALPEGGTSSDPRRTV